VLVRVVAVGRGCSQRVCLVFVVDGRAVATHSLLRAFSLCRSLIFLGLLWAAGCGFAPLGFLIRRSSTWRNTECLHPQSQSGCNKAVRAPVAITEKSYIRSQVRELPVHKDVDVGTTGAKGGTQGCIIRVERRNEYLNPWAFWKRTIQTSRCL